MVASSCHNTSVGFLRLPPSFQFSEMAAELWNYSEEGPWAQKISFQAMGRAPASVFTSFISFYKVYVLFLKEGPTVYKL